MKKRLMTIICGLTIAMGSYAYADSYIMETIEAGDTYGTISERHAIELNILKDINKDLGDVLQEGKLIKIRPVSDDKKISIKVNGETILTDEAPYMENNRVFVPIRFIAETLGVKIAWNEESEAAILKNSNLNIKLPLGSQEVMINNDEIKLDAPINVYRGRTFVPVRFIAEAFDCTVKWDAQNYIVNISTKEKSNVVKSDEDIYWLSRIVEAESKGESFEGKLAVANVIINRKNSDKFPNSIKEVVFDNQNGYIQFSPVIDGTIYNTPSEESIKAAKMALNGNNNIGNSLYFLNPDIASNLWTLYNKILYKSIGNHDFYL